MDLRKKIDEAKMPEKVEKEAIKQIEALSKEVQAGNKTKGDVNQQKAK